MDSLIELRDLAFAYEGCAPTFSGISCRLGSGKLCALMGGNGSGKTTLIKSIAGLLPGYDGQIRIGNDDIKDLSRRRIARQMSMVAQDNDLAFPYRVGDMVLMGRAPYIDTFALPGRDDKAKALQALADVGMQDFKNRYFSKISGGERQMVLIARALAQDTPVMLLDEPTNHLDFKNKILVLHLIKRLVQERNLLALMATHDPNHVLQFADYVMILHEGRIFSEGQPSEVINRETMRAVYGVDVEEIVKDGRIRGVMAREQLS